MSRRHKAALQQIFQKPTRPDIRWSAIESLVRSLGGDVIERSGSRVAFRLGEHVAVFHRPHPKPETTKSTVEDVREFLEKAGVKP